eukprot:TRINITY_DN44492_c0_g1_i1.p1 TRINITY_DN44492_c0_g1~~TRINITY_DN44492_c0_g1_i1.p1  ORF type:complete len:244 (+),score=29.31 TRINITY_DN44492_c0_g1_i1:64-795(+)
MSCSVQQPLVQYSGARRSLVARARCLRMLIVASMVPACSGSVARLGGLVADLTSAVQHQQFGLAMDDRTNSRSSSLNTAFSDEASLDSRFNIDAHNASHADGGHTHIRASSVAGFGGNSIFAALLRQASSIAFKREEHEVMSFKDALKCCIQIAVFSCIVSVLYALYLRFATTRTFYEGFADVIWFQLAVVAAATIALVLTCVSPLTVPWVVLLTGTAMNIGFYRIQTPGAAVTVRCGNTGVK